MQSFLGDYKNARKNPIPKFHRAVESFLMQDYEDKELIIVSDNCPITNQEYENEWSMVSSIKLVKSFNSTKWPGGIRNLGIIAAEGEWITYLDSDDIIIENRLTNLYNQIQRFPKAKSILIDGNELYPANLREDKPILGSISILGKTYEYIEDDIIRRHPSNVSIGVRFYTSRISHRRDIESKWPSRDIRGEDGEFSRMLMKEGDFVAVNNPTYLVCHSIGLYDV